MTILVATARCCVRRHVLVARRRRRTGFFCVNCNLCTVFLRSREIGVGCSYAPHDIVTHLREVAPTLRPGRQEDAQEFLAQLLGISGLHAKEQSPPLDVCPVMRGQLVGCVQCTVCGTKSFKFDPFETLSVEIGALDNLEDMLRHFSASEWLDGANKYRCGGACGHALVSFEATRPRLG